MKWDDPSLSAAELATLAKTEPRAYLNPNMSFETLVRGAGQYPWYVAANPITPLLQLEDPEAFQQLHTTLRHGWREQAGLRTLSEQGRRLYLADCAEHALPMYEKLHPNDQRLRDALQVARQFALHKTSFGTLQTTHAVMTKMEMALSVPPTPAYYAVSAVARATAPQMTTQHVINGAKAALWATQKAYGFEETLDWQLGRVLHYLFLEHPEYQSPAQVGGKSRVGGTLFDPSEQGKQPSPEDLVLLMACSKELYNAYLPLLEIEQLADPSVQVPRLTPEERLGAILGFLPQEVAKLAKRVIPAIRKAERKIKYLDQMGAVQDTLDFLQGDGIDGRKRSRLTGELESCECHLVDYYDDLNDSAEEDPAYWAIQALINFLNQGNVGLGGAALDALRAIYGNGNATDRVCDRETKALLPALHALAMPSGENTTPNTRAKKAKVRR